MAVTGYTKLGPLSKLIAAADQGQYFLATNPTPGTGIASGTVTSLADTTPVLLFQNNNTVQSAIRCYLDAFWVEITAVTTGYTNHFMSFKIDPTQSTNRYTSGGSTITPVNPNADSGAATKTNVYFGAITAAAASSSVRLLESHRLRTVIPVIGDQHFFDFGAGQGQAQANLPNEGTLQVSKYYACSPVIVGPQEWFSAHFWGASAAAGTTFEFGFRWLEL